MKRIICILSLLAIGAAASANAIQADNSSMKEQQGNKNECLLVAINCGNDFVSLEQKIESLQKEISKGRAVYSNDELQNLKKQLNNATKTLEYFKNEGAGNWYKYPGE